jgi:hypothetical protein
MSKPLFRSALLTLVCASLSAGFLACGATRANLTPEESMMTKEGVLSVNVEWIKDKKKKYDIRLAIHNEANKAIIVKLGDMQCYRGARQGILHHTFFNTGERTIDFSVGQQKVFQMVCDLGTRTKGPYRIVFGKVYDNPSNDGATLGKVISESIEWKANDSG